MCDEQSEQANRQAVDGDKVFTICDRNGNEMAKVGTLDHRPFAHFYPVSGVSLMMHEHPDGSLKMTIHDGEVMMFIFELLSNRKVSIVSANGDIRDEHRPLTNIDIQLPQCWVEAVPVSDLPKDADEEQ